MKHLNERGYALFLTISVITFITVLALGLITLTANSQKTTVGERYDQSLFYIAESGINLEKAKVAQVLNDAHVDAIKVLNKPRTEKEFQDFITPYGDVKGFYISYIEGNFCSIYSNIVDVNNCAKNKDITIKNHYNHYNTQFNKQPITATETSGKCIEDSRNVSCLFTILSTAKYDSEPANNRSLEQTLKLDFNTTPTNDSITLVDTVSGISLTNLAALIPGNITVNGNAHLVKGNIASKEDLRNVNFYKGYNGIKIEEEINLSTMLPIKPKAPDNYTPLTEIGNKILSGDIMVDKLKKDSVIYIGDGNVNLFVNEADLTGVKIIGSGNINIIIRNKINLEDNFNDGGNSHKTTIFYEGSFPKIKSATKINASLYTNELPDFTGQGSLKVKGNIYHPGDETLTLSGNSSLTANAWIAPTAKIELKGGGNVDNFTGTIIAKDLSIKGNIDLIGGSNLALPSTSSKYGSESDTIKESSLKEI